MANEYTSQGTLLKVTISALATSIPGIKGLKGPTINWDVKDTTALDAPSNFKTKKPIMKDPGTVTFQIKYDPADPTHEYLRNSNAASTPTLEAFTEVLSDTGAATITFSGYVTKFEYAAESGEILMADVEVTVTGAVTFTA